MNGVHDMGGMHGMGPIRYEKDEPVFHQIWEGRVWAMTRSMRAHGFWNLDEDRHAIERLPPEQLLRFSYYEKWFAALVDQVVRHELATEAEIESGHAAAGAERATPAITPARASLVLDRTIPSAHDATVKPNFKLRERVRALNINPPGHTRLARYARGKIGTIVRDHGVYILPDNVAHGLGEKRQHVYSVQFRARELWGESASRNDFVHLDMWDDYLERA